MRTVVRIVSIVSVLMCIGCAEPIVLDPEEGMPLVVNCVLDRPYDWWEVLEDYDFFIGYPEDLEIPVQYLDLFRAKRPSETEVRKIEDAKVCIMDGLDQTFEFKWNGERYECQFLPRFGMSYRLEVTTQEGETLKAATIFPPRVRLQGCPVLLVFGVKHSISSYYYAESLVINHRTYGDVIHSYTDYPPYTKPYNVWISASEGSDEKDIPIMTNHPEADDFNVMSGDWPSESNVAFQEADFGIHNTYGALWDLYKDVWTKSSAHDKFVRIHQTGEMPSIFEEGVECSTAPIAGRDSRLLFALNAEFDYENDVTEHKEAKYICRFVSDDYDLFLRDVAGKFLVNGENFASYYSEGPIYSNIKGGKGIFGAVSETSVAPGSFNIYQYLGF